MTGSGTAEDVVRRFVSAGQGLDADVHGLLAPDVERHPTARQVGGREIVTVEVATAELELVGERIVEMFAVRDRVVAVIETTRRRAASGTIVVQAGSRIFEVRDGLITSIWG